MSAAQTQPTGGVLPELPALQSGIAVGYEPIYTADQMRAYGELCRTTQAAPVPADPYREHLAQQAENIDTKRLARALIWMGVSPAGDGQEGFAARLGENVNRLTRAVDAHKAGFTAKAADPVAAWLPIASAPEGELVVVGWLDAEDLEHPERHDFDYLEDGCWMRHADNHENFVMVAPPGSCGPSEAAPYTHWIKIQPLPAAPSIPHAEGGV